MTTSPDDPYDLPALQMAGNAYSPPANSNSRGCIAVIVNSQLDLHCNNGNVRYHNAVRSVRTIYPGLQAAPHRAIDESKRRAVLQFDIVGPEHRRLSALLFLIPSLKCLGFERTITTIALLSTAFIFITSSPFPFVRYPE